MNQKNEVPRPHPKIDDSFWFGISESLVKGAAEALEKAGEKIQNLIVWLWGVYTTAFVVGFALSEREVPWWLGLLVSFTSVLLVAVYWLAVLSRMPISVEFDPRSPTEIQAAYAMSIGHRKRRLRVTLALSAVATTLLAGSIFAASLYQPSGRAPSFDAQLVSGKDSTAEVIVSAKLDTSDAVALTIAPLEKRDPPVEAMVFRPASTDSGVIAATYPLTIDLPVLVTLSWVDKTDQNIEWSRVLRQEDGSAK